MEGASQAAVRWRLFLLFGLAFVGFYGSADWLTSQHGWRWSIAPTRWPFWPDWAGVYLSLDLLLPLTFALVALESLPFLAASLLAATVLAWPLFLLFPLAPIPRLEGNLALQMADALNLSANYFPSLHVAYAVVCAVWLRRWWVWLWAGAIALSTLFTHQHYTIDVVGGVVLALGAFFWARGRGRVEALCLGEFARCAARHRRYAGIGAALYTLSAFGPRRRRLARVGFCYLQRLDDLLDGHLVVGVEPEDVAQEQIRKLRGELEWETGSGSVLDDLGRAFAAEISARDTVGGIALAEAVIEEMRLDRRRVRDGLLLDEAELDHHLERTFELSLDLMLLAADSPLRASQAPHLLKALGWCSIVRDWDEDLALGLINVPRDVWEGGTVEAWRDRRLEQALRDLRVAGRELAALRGRPGHRLLALFWRSVWRYSGERPNSLASNE